MPFPLHHVPLSHLAPLFYPEQGVNTFTYLSDPQTSYASMNLNWVAKHISYL